MIGGATRIPRIRYMVRHYFGGKEPYNNGDDKYIDEGVAKGAVVEGGFISGAIDIDERILLRDSTSISIGVATQSLLSLLLSKPVMSVLIEKDTKYPVNKATRLY